jgi:hypothetical protein
MAAGNKWKGLPMQVTIVVPDNIVAIDGRALPIDCSSIDGNIRIVQWYDTFGTVEFLNTPGKTYRANGTLDGIGEFQDVLDAWAVLADKIGASELLQRAPPQQAVEMIEQIDANPDLQAVPLGEAADTLRKIQIDGDLDVEALGLDECVRLYNIIQSEPALLAIYPGAAVQTLQKIEADPDLSAMPMADAVDRVLHPPAVPTPQQQLIIDAHVETQQRMIEVHAAAQVAAQAAAQAAPSPPLQPPQKPSGT